LQSKSPGPGDDALGHRRDREPPGRPAVTNTTQVVKSEPDGLSVRQLVTRLASSVPCFASASQPIAATASAATFKDKIRKYI
jgi:hypothetical protein